MPSDKASRYLASLGPGARIIDNFVPTSRGPLTTPSSTATMDQVSASSSSSSSSSTPISTVLSPNDHPPETGARFADPVEIPLSDRIVRPPSTGGVRCVSEAASLATSTLVSHPTVGRQDALVPAHLAPVFSASSSVQGPNFSAPIVGHPTATPTGIAPNPQPGHTPYFPLPGIAPNMQGSVQNPLSFPHSAPQLNQMFSSQGSQLQGSFPPQQQHFPSPSPQQTIDSALSYLMSVARCVDPSGNAAHLYPPRVPPQQPPGVTATQTSQSTAAPPMHEARSSTSFDQLPEASESVVSSEVGSEDEGVNDRRRTGFSFTESVSLLLHTFPDMAAADTEVDDSDLSMAAIALGMGSSGHREPRLRETSCVSTSMSKALSSVRGSKGKGGVSADNVPHFPSALPCGIFLPSEKPPFIKSILERHSIPDGPMQASAQDLSLIQDGSKSDKRTVTLSDRIFAEVLEENVRKSLEAVSILDSFLAGFIRSVRHPDSPSNEFQIREEMDTECLGSFASASVSLMQFLASNMAKLHTNIRLGRKDALLSASSHNKDVRASLRAAPPDPDGSFFGSCASSSIEHEAKLRRDLHFLQPESKQPRSQFSRGPKRSSSAPSSGRRSSFASTKPKSKPQSDRFRPYPSRGANQSPAKGKGDKRRSSHKGGHPQ